MRKKRQKSSNHVKNIFDNFRAAPFLHPLLGGSDSGPTSRDIAMLSLRYQNESEEENPTKQK